jgi:1-deoxy-D-xylulose-5-phosphate reductoisomerase
MIHSFVEFIDNSVIAQLGPPDMRTPIQYTLTYPNRFLGNSRAMDWTTIGQMDFEQIDRERFGSINLAYDVIRQGGSSGAVFNAANEVAVEAFLSGRIRFGQITQLVAEAMQQLPVKPIEDLADCLKADQEARDMVNKYLEVAAATH